MSLINSHAAWRLEDVSELWEDEAGKQPVNEPIDKISTYIEGRRIMPPNTPFPGFWQNSRTPYLVEVMDNMSPASFVQHTAFMKAAQIGATAGCENIIAYWMDESPTEILYISATQDLLNKWATKRLEPVIDSCGFRHKIYAQTENKGSRRTGDKTFSKEYVGGNLDMASAQSASSLRSDSKRVLIRDEIDGAPALLRTGEGNWLKVSLARTRTWGHRKKILDLSTPTLFGQSMIADIFEQGDQRYFFVPCPHCGKEQILQFGSEQSAFGLKKETTAGKDPVIFYLCEHCRDAIFNHHKTKMLSGGHWVPKAKSSQKTLRSYQMSSLYSPVGMYSWAEMYAEYESCLGDPDLMAAFVNLNLGLPFKESGTKPKLEKVIELKGGYRRGQVNDDVLYITMGLDVQTGSKVDPKNPPRLEFEILGIGAGYRTWSIDYKKFIGPVDDPFSGAWEDLNEWAMKGGLVLEKKNGKKMPVNLIFMDSGDGNMTDIVYRFCERWGNTYPIKGFSALRKKKHEKGDEVGPQNFKRYRVVKAGLGNQILYEISTNFYKTQIYNNLKVERTLSYPQKPGFCDFPFDYTERYFQMLTAEEKRSDGSFHLPSGRRNEALDCFDFETEVLTEDGWKRFYHLSKKDLLATCNLEKNHIEYQKPQALICRYVDSEMVHLKGRRINILVTPNHRMVTHKKVYERQPDGSKKWNLHPDPKITLAKNLTIHHQIKVASDWVGYNEESFIFPSVKNKNGTIIIPEKRIDFSVWCSFLGWFVSEGSTFKGRSRTQGNLRYRVQIDQNPGRKSAIIEGLLKKMPFNWRRSKSRGSFRWICTSKQLYKAVIQCGIGVKNKKVPAYIKRAKTENIKLFISSAILGDGWIQDGHRRYCTISKQLANDMQELFIKIGNASNIKKIIPKPYNSTKNFSMGSKDGTNVSLQYHVSELRYKKASLDSSAGGARHYLGKKKLYTGYVYCATVPNGTLICRRRGKSFIAGNCRVYALCAADVYLDSLVQQMRAALKAQGASAVDIQQFTYRMMIDLLEKKNKAALSGG